MCLGTEPWKSLFHYILHYVVIESTWRSYKMKPWKPETIKDGDLLCLLILHM